MASRPSTSAVEWPLRLYDRPRQLGLAVAFGLACGAVSLRFSPLWALVALVGVGVGLAAIKRPEVALLGILIATSSVVFEDRLPTIDIGVGSLHVPDVLLLGSLSLVLIRLLAEPDFHFVHTPLDWPLLGFLGLAMLSTVVAILRSSLAFSEGLRELRVVSYYLTYFVVTNLVREDCQIRLLVRGLLLLATIVAAAMVAQALVGWSVPLLAGRVEALQTQGVSYDDVTRVLPPGQSIVVVGFITTTVVCVVDRGMRHGLLGLAQWALLGLAVLVSFTRSFWMQAGLAALALAYLTGRGSVKRLAKPASLVLLSLMVVSLLSLGSPDSHVSRLVTATIERMATLGTSRTLSENSLQWRYVENSYVLPQVLSHPLLGLGLGARYRPTDPRIDYPGREWDARNYIHNGHFWIVMQAGIPAYLCLACLSVIYVVRGLKYWRRIPDPHTRSWVLGFVLAYAGVPIGAIVNPMFMQWYWTPVIGVIMGLSEIAIGKVAHAGRADEQYDTGSLTRAAGAQRSAGDGSQGRAGSFTGPGSRASLSEAGTMATGGNG